MMTYKISKFAFFVFLAIVLSFLVSACASTTSSTNPASGPVTPTSAPIAIEFLNGATGVSIDASFQQTYSHELDSSTVTTDTVFIVEGAAQANIAASNIKAFDSSTCDVSKKLASTVTLSTDKKTITITPPTMNSNTKYYLGMTGIKYLKGTPIDDKCIDYTTQSDLSSMFISSITTDAYYDINLSTTPLKVKFDRAIDADSVSGFYVTGSKVQGEDLTLDGTWALDTTDSEGRTASFTPSETVPNCDLLYVNMPVTARDATDTPFGSIAASGFLLAEFTTLYSYDSDFTNTTFQDNFYTCWSESFNKDAEPLPSDTFSFTSDGLIYTGPAPYNYGGTWGSSTMLGKTMSDDKFTATLYIKSLSLNSEEVCEPTEEDDCKNLGGIGLGVRGDADRFQIVAFIKDGALYFALTQDLGDTFTDQTANMTNGEIWLQMKREGTTLTASYSLDGGATPFVALGTFTSSLAADYYLEIPLYFRSGVVENFTGVIKSLTFDW